MYNFFLNICFVSRCSDGGIFAESTLYEAIQEDNIGFPPPRPLANANQPFPFCIIADEAFALRPWLIKPYPKRNITRQKRIFNYRLCRARRVVENAFGILAHRYIIYMFIKKFKANG